MPEQVVLEHPHPTIHYARFDTVILDGQGQPVTAVEFKYDPPGPESSGQPGPQKVLSAFADLRKLALAPGISERYFIYVMDIEVARYLCDPRNTLHKVFALSFGDAFKLDDDYFASVSSTLHASLGRWPSGVRVEGVTAKDLPCEHCLRVYSVGKESEH